MLGSKKHSTPARSTPPAAEGKPVDTIDTLVGQKAVFKGDLEFSGGLRVDGQIKGNVIATDDSNSTVVISESGIIEGNITVPHVIINGTINGNIKSGGRVELQSKSRINGDVHYKAVEMELGASINGNLVCDPSGGSATRSASGSPGATAGISDAAAFGDTGQKQSEAPRPASVETG
jgi:cytoskeletal protein CcmA (bactofilin family)